MTTAFPAAFFDGVRHFNSGRFFEAHESFEELLDEVEEDERWELLVALIQVAVGYHKASSGYVGAERMLGSGLEKLGPFPEVAFGVELGRLRTRIAEDLAALAQGVSFPQRMTTDPPRIRMS